MNKFNRVATTSERIKEALKLRDMRQTDLAQITDIDKGSISSYISGRYEPKNEAVYKMANALSVSEMWLWGYDVPIERPTDRTVPTLGEIISAYRHENNMSMDDFAKKSGLSKSYISVLEKNKRPGSNKPVEPSVGCVMQVADAIGVNFMDLMLATCDAGQLKKDMFNLDYVAEEGRDTVAQIIEANHRNDFIENSKKTNPKEKHVVEIFRSLNDDGQDRVVEYAEYVRDTGKYSPDASYLRAKEIAEERKAEERKAHEKKSVSAPAKHTI